MDCIRILRELDKLPAGEVETAIDNLGIGEDLHEMLKDILECAN